MGVMRKILLSMLVFLAIASLPTIASVTIEESTDAEHLINSGFSQALAEDVFVMKNRANGKPVEPLYEKSQNVIVKAWRKLFSYTDPAQDTYDRLHHDIKLQPSFSDL